MPVYRIGNTMVHIKASARGNMPAPCVAPHPHPTEPGRMSHCRGPSAVLCDWENSDGSLCSAPICSEHATTIGPDKHLCPLHAKQHAAAKVVQPDLFARAPDGDT